MSLLSKLRERPDEWTDSSRLQWMAPSGAGIGGAVGALVATPVEPWGLPGGLLAAVGAGVGATVGLLVAAALD